MAAIPHQHTGTPEDGLRVDIGALPHLEKPRFAGLVRRVGPGANLVFTATVLALCPAPVAEGVSKQTAGPAKTTELDALPW